VKRGSCEFAEIIFRGLRSCVLIFIALGFCLQLLIPDNYSSLLLSSSGTGSMFKLPANPVTTALTEALAVVVATLSKTLPYAASVAASQSKASSTPSYGKSAASNDSILSQCNDVAR